MSHRDEMQLVLNQLLSSLSTIQEDSDEISKEDLLEILRTVTKLLKSVKEQYDAVFELR